MEFTTADRCLSWDENARIIRERERYEKEIIKLIEYGEHFVYYDKVEDYKARRGTMLDMSRILMFDEDNPDLDEWKELE